jgi:hypothetical protein
MRERLEEDEVQIVVIMASPFGLVVKSSMPTPPRREGAGATQTRCVQEEGAERKSRQRKTIHREPTFFRRPTRPDPFDGAS